MPNSTADDDWETAYSRNDSDDPTPAESINAKLWLAANSSTPSYHITSSSTAYLVPPPTAFTPALTILKRPTTSTPTSRSNSFQGKKERTLEERNRDYAEARARIYGTPLPSPSSPTPSNTASPSASTVNVNGTGGESKSSSLKGATNSTERLSREIDRLNLVDGMNGGGGKPNLKATKGSSATKSGGTESIRNPRGPPDAAASASSSTGFGKVVVDSSTNGVAGENGRSSSGRGRRRKG